MDPDLRPFLEEPTATRSEAPTAVDAGLLVALAMCLTSRRWWESDLYMRGVALRGVLNPPLPARPDFVRVVGSL